MSNGLLRNVLMSRFDFSRYFILLFYVHSMHLSPPSQTFASEYISYSLKLFCNIMRVVKHSPVTSLSHMASSSIQELCRRSQFDPEAFVDPSRTILEGLVVAWEWLGMELKELAKKKVDKQGYHHVVHDRLQSSFVDLFCLIRALLQQGKVCNCNVCKDAPYAPNQKEGGGKDYWSDRIILFVCSHDLVRYLGENGNHVDGGTVDQELLKGLFIMSLLKSISLSIATKDVASATYTDEVDGLEDNNSPSMQSMYTAHTLITISPPTAAETNIDSLPTKPQAIARMPIEEEDLDGETEMELSSLHSSQDIAEMVDGSKEFSISSESADASSYLSASCECSSDGIFYPGNVSAAEETNCMINNTESKNVNIDHDNAAAIPKSSKKRKRAVENTGGKANFVSNERVYVALSKIPKAGQGLFAKEWIRKDEIVCTYGGNLVDGAEAIYLDPTYMLAYEKSGKGLKLQGDDVDGDLGHFANGVAPENIDPMHREINAKYVFKTLESSYSYSREHFTQRIRLPLIATKDIAPDSEIIVDYGKGYWNTMKIFWRDGLPIKPASSIERDERARRRGKEKYIA